MSTSWVREKELKAYLAGFVDGEGSIGISRLLNPTQPGRRTPVYTPIVTVTNTNKCIISFIKSIFGGYMSIKKGDTIFKRAKTCYALMMTHRVATNFIKYIFPYLRIKRQQAETVLKFREYRDEHSHYAE